MAEKKYKVTVDCPSCGARNTERNVMAYATDNLGRVDIVAVGCILLELS